MINLKPSNDLLVDPLVFVQRQLYIERRKFRFFRATYFTLSVLINLGALAIAVITPLVLSGMYFGTVLPRWFFYVTASISAIGGFLTSLLNFFIIKQKLIIARDNRRFIQKQIVLYMAHTGGYDGDETAHNSYAIYRAVTRKLGLGADDETD